MIQRSIITGALFAFLAVILGAFGAHGLKDNPAMTAQTLQSFDTGARYQMYHALALILLGILAKVFGENKLLRGAFILFTVGIIFFSGSIYILSTQEITGIHWSWLGPVTPVGGLLFISGWLMIVISFIRNSKSA